MLKQIYEKKNNEISARIYLQIQTLFADSILSDKKDFFYDYSFAVMHKLNATKYHLNNYRRIENEQYNMALHAYKKKKIETRESLELIFELEAFLYQIKSSLDMLVKLLIPIIGNGFVNTETYGNKGEKLIPGLTQYKNKRGVRIEAVDNLIELIKNDKDLWLEKVVSYRDELNHTKGLRNYHFEPVQLPNGQIIPKKPTFKDYDTVKFMNIAYQNNLEFHQDFLAFALALVAPQSFILIPYDKTQKEFGDIGEYVKWAWGFTGIQEQQEANIDK